VTPFPGLYPSLLKKLTLYIMPHFENAQIRDIKGGMFYDIRGEARVQVSTGGGLSGM
jgi:hypothetical protein